MWFSCCWCVPQGADGMETGEYSVHSNTLTGSGEVVETDAVFFCTCVPVVSNIATWKASTFCCLSSVLPSSHPFILLPHFIHSGSVVCVFTLNVDLIGLNPVMKSCQFETQTGNFHPPQTRSTHSDLVTILRKEKNKSDISLGCHSESVNQRFVFSRWNLFLCPLQQRHSSCPHTSQCFPLLVPDLYSLSIS